MDINKEMSTYIHLSKYSRWIDKEGRRETWDETIDRLFEFWYNRMYSDGITDNAEFDEVFEAVRRKEVMPSMRTLQTAGKALERDEVSGFNCAAIAISHPRAFDEIFFLLMCGCGVGFSVERKYTEKLPEIAEEFHETDTTLVIRDSKIGWAKGLKELLAFLYNGDIPKWDLSSVRPSGARLKTFGGRASGPGPLDSLFRYCVHLFTRSKGRKLNSLDCHDLVCKIADTVIVGSVRRSALISFSNLTDDRMRGAKMGEWYFQNPERALANNSVAYTEKPDLDSFLKEFRSIYKSKAGERGVVYKEALRNKAESCGREHDGDYLLNPCGEAILRDTGGLCNLTEVVIRPEDTIETLKKKVRYASILGTLQSTLVNYRYLRKIWSKNQEEERLLGISFTGIMDHPFMSGRVKEEGGMTLPEALDTLKEEARKANEEWAEALVIQPSRQLTLIKPSGTVSQLVGTASGIHPRFSKYYFRRVVQDKKDPLTDLMRDLGIPFVERNEKTIFSFPIKAHDNAVCVKDVGPLEQLSLWKIYRDHWCEGNPSQTIYYTDDSFLDVQSWVWKNFDSIGGLSFFPYDDFIYDKEAQPYLEITEEEYNKAVEEFPKDLNWGRLVEFEKEDNTETEKTFACGGGSCDV